MVPDFVSAAAELYLATSNQKYIDAIVRQFAFWSQMVEARQLLEQSIDLIYFMMDSL